MVRDAARMGLGVTILPRMLVDEDLESGTLVPLLEDYPVTSYWIKLLVPRLKLHRSPVNALVRFLKDSVPTDAP